jgi:hypothetical protein
MKTLALALIATAFLSVGFAESAFARSTRFHNHGATVTALTHPGTRPALPLNRNSRHLRSIRGHQGHI